MQTYTCRVILFGLLFPLFARAANGPVLAQSLGALPDGLGVNIHFTDPRPGEMRMLADAGFRWVRMDFGWASIEREKGEYDFSAYDRLIKTLDADHIRAVFILDYSNPHYDNNLSPHTDEGRAAFARWAAASVVHFKGRGVVWEMYNEPNIFFWRPKPNVAEYAKLALAVGKAIREADPQAIYIGPACSTMDFKFLESCFKAGCLEYWAAVSVHPYRQENPERVAPDYKRLRELIAKYAPAGKQIPIVSGEWGYSSSWKNFDAGKQGRYLPRELLTNIASGVPISIWYDWHEDGQSPSDPEHRFGIVGYEYHEGRDPVYDPKPAYLAMKTLSSALKGCTFVRRLNAGSDADWALLFHGAEGDRIVVWTTTKEHEATLPLTSGRFHVTTHTGSALPIAHSSGKGLNMMLTDAPSYLISEKR
jgi:polysaccharide biosynthesis protein PslG